MFEETRSKEIRCAIYTRTSTDDRLNQELNSLVAQRLICEKYIKNQQGWITLPKRYDDGNKSGENLNRPKVKELFRDIERGEIDCVVVYKFDRLSRDTLDCAKIDNFFKEYNVIYVSVTEPFDNKTVVGKFIKTVLSGAGQYEREITTDRVRDKIAISKQNGLWMGGTPPLGYDAKEKKLIINEEEAKVIKHIFERFIELKSITVLARELNRQGYRTKRFEARSGGGGIFTKATVRRMITNPIYAGKIRHHEKHYEGQHEGIIGEEKWNKVQALIESRPHRTAKYEEALLKSVIRCQLCNVNMIPTYTVKKNKRYRYYVCNNHLRGKHCPSRNRSVVAGEAEREVEKQIRYILKHSEEETRSDLKELDEIWEDLFPVKQQEIIKELIRTVWVREDGVETFIKSKDFEEVYAA